MEEKEYKDEEYRIIFGVEKNTFDSIVSIAELKYAEEHQKGGRKDGVTPRQRVEIALKYSRQYSSQRYLAIEYDIAKSCISPIVKWVMKNVVSSQQFSLFNRVQNMTDNSEDRLIDVTETYIDRPTKNQRKWYSGKKKKHTAKTQVEVGADTLLIYSLSFAKGSTHDFKLFKDSKIDYNTDSTIFVDMGYIGIKKYIN